jgi:hypothetical protein
MSEQTDYTQTGRIAWNVVKMAVGVGIFSTAAGLYLANRTTDPITGLSRIAIVTTAERDALSRMTASAARNGEIVTGSIGSVRLDPCTGEQKR